MTSTWEHPGIQQPLRRTVFSARGLEEALSSPPLTDFLNATKLDLTELSPRSALTARVSTFPRLTLAHVVSPQAAFVWRRDRSSLDRAVVLIARGDSLEVRSRGPVLRRRPGFFLIPPGDAAVAFRALEHTNEILYVRLDAASMSDIPLKAPIGAELLPMQPAVAAPLCSFVTTLCSMSLSDPTAGAPLAGAAREVARTFVQLIAGADQHDLGLFALAMQVIVREYPRQDLSVATIAHRLHVSSRTLQSAFTREGTSVSVELRRARVHAALEIRRKNPGLPAAALATATGFGSTSTLFRALRERALADARLASG